MPGLLTVEEALACVLEHAAPLGVGPAALSAALGRVLATDVESDGDHPAFRRSKVDGWAVRAADAGEVLRSVCEVPAGKPPGDRIGPGEAARIFTGAPVPEGADRVAKQEDCTPVPAGEDGAARVRVPAAALAEDHVVPQGAECRRGAVVARRGDVITPARVGVLASVGAATVAVFARPRVRVLSTGDELCPVEAVPPPGRIRNSNAPALAAACAACGADVVGLASARDDAGALRAELQVALDADVALVTGGVSVGDYDLVPPALETLGVRRVFHGVRLQPGKPAWFGVRGRTLVFALPGNPVSALVNHTLFVAPALARLQGRTVPTAPFEVRLGGPVGAGGRRRRYVPATASRRDATCIATPVPFQGSGDVFGFAAADLLVLVDEGAEARAAGAAARAVAVGGTWT